jgi:hypothetical protein
MSNYDVVSGLEVRGFARIDPTDKGAERWEGNGVSLTLKPGLDYWLLAGDGLGHDWLMFKTLNQLDLLLKLLAAYRSKGSKTN